MELEIFKIKDELDGYLQNPNMIAWAIELTLIISLKSKNKMYLTDIPVCREIHSFEWKL